MSGEAGELAERFFRDEYARMTAVIARRFGPGSLDLAEDVVQEALLQAVRVWSWRGTPDDPAAWLYTVARNKAVNILKQRRRENLEADPREARGDDFAPESFSPEGIADDTLRMMFICCDPAVPRKAQIALILKTLCGLSRAEIARAFLTSEETINKRLSRARKTLRREGMTFELSRDELRERLDMVLRTLYLLFNEGYSAGGGPHAVRYDICFEALRFMRMLGEDERFDREPDVHALAALMLLNAARFPARVDGRGGIVEMETQDRKLWDRGLIRAGLRRLEKSTVVGRLSRYHILAMISAHHCAASTYESTDWTSILSLYDALMQIEPSPVVALNRAVVLARVYGETAALEVLAGLKDAPGFQRYHPYYSTLARLNMTLGRYEEAAGYITTAMSLTRVAAELDLLRGRLEQCRKGRRGG